MKAITTVTVLAFALLLAGCNTVRGFGQDVQKVGGKIEEKARK
jgi:predicted small secreted protein